MTAQARGSSLRAVRDTLGLAAVAVGVVLAWPGIRIAQAGDAAPESAVVTVGEAQQMSVDPLLVQAQAGPAAGEGPSCSSPGVPSPLGDAMIEHQVRRAMQQMVQRMAAEQPGEADADRGIVLNSRGYNYRSVRAGAIP